ncbi:uncharacterized protein EV420DRAFT_1723970 [Desarmillaria tabescens]|uniref:Uncharacterized protein n=1 Tax=Armillaria tabescens TaxID=1929756 RepID=A0AA39MRS2_ARMTA|nr:uncharacterized protein EV420DRAFT_1723970 [Desarmillaria tabescens]KAK0443420.1 hypothetical protein EV420DRAFT_1723970 [Desarmillaria tabescens]
MSLFEMGMFCTYSLQNGTLWGNISQSMSLKSTTSKLLSAPLISSKAQRFSWSFEGMDIVWYRHHYDPQPFKVTHPTWERLIDEREIEITEWIYDMNRRGRWNNTDVEIWYGHEDRYLRFVQRTIVSLDALRQRNLDLHFKVLGHLVRDDEVVGIVMEPKGGRYVEFRDRALAYNIFQELQKDNLLIGFPQFSFSNMKISDGKVHFETRTLQLLRDLSYEHDPERLAHTRKNHWDSLDPMMDILESLMRVRNQNP